MISLMRPEPTLFLAASFTLYHEPHLRLSSLKDRSLELMNTSFHSSLLSTEYCSTKPAREVCLAQVGQVGPGTPQQHHGAGLRAGTPSRPLSPRMELPPLSPGIHVRVMDEAEVLETVRRGWSGGTVGKPPGLTTRG